MRNSIALLMLTGVFIAASAAVAAQNADPLQILQSGASQQEKAEACRALSIHANKEALPVLAGLLCDEQLSHMARYALEPMPFPEVNGILRDALAQCNGLVKVGIISSLGVRKDAEAVPVLSSLLADADPQIAQAAAGALGSIGGRGAIEPLETALAQANIPAATQRICCNALLACAEGLSAKDSPEERREASAVYHVLFTHANLSKTVRAAALRGEILLLSAAPWRADGSDAAAKLAEAIQSEDEALFAAGLRAAQELKQTDIVSTTLAGGLPGASVDRKIRIIQTLGKCGGVAAGVAVFKEAQEGPAEVRVAALHALARMGYEPALELMARWAVDGEDGVVKAARNALCFFPNGAGKPAIMALRGSEQAGTRLIAVELIGQGGLDNPNALLLEMAEKDADEGVRVAALRALKDCAGMDEMPALLANLQKGRSASEMQATEDALRMLCERQKKMPAGLGAIPETFCAAYETAQGETKLAILRLLGATNGSKAFETVRAATASEDAAIKDTALRTLCDWSHPEALSALLDLYKTASDPALKTLALRGTVRLLAPGNLPDNDLLGHYAALLDGTASPEEKKVVLGGLTQVPQAGAFEIALAQLGDASVKPEAVQTALSIAKSFGKSPSEDTAFFNGTDLTGWQGNMQYWRVEDGAIVAQSDGSLTKNEFLWSGAESRDFYLAVDVLLEPNTGNGGVQFRSQKIDERGQAQGYQGDIGQDVWGRLYHEHGRGKLDWTDRAEQVVKPGEWNRLEILAIGPAIWTAINGKLGVAFLDFGKDERTGLFAFQLHAGPAQTIRYKVVKLVHNPKLELGKIPAELLIFELHPLEKQ